jgi:predicted RNA binding protein YcfA (HicA-like mRNA interferase family)
MTRKLNSREVEKAVRKHPDGFSIVAGNGSHFGVRGPDGSKMTVVRGTMSVGVSHVVIKWFKAFGIIITLILMFRLMPFILAFCGAFG